MKKKILNASEMGKIGGAKLRDQRGSEYYRRIAVLGRAKHGPDFYKNLSQKGVEARKKKRKERELMQSPLHLLAKVLVGS